MILSSQRGETKALCTCISHSPGIMYFPLALMIRIPGPWVTNPTLARPMIRPFLITTVMGAAPPSRVLTTWTFVKISVSGADAGFDSALSRVVQHRQIIRDTLIPAPENRIDRLSVGRRRVKQIQASQLFFRREERRFEGVARQFPQMFVGKAE